MLKARTHTLKPQACVAHVYWLKWIYI